MTHTQLTTHEAALIHGYLISRSVSIFIDTPLRCSLDEQGS